MAYCTHRARPKATWSYGEYLFTGMAGVETVKGYSLGGLGIHKYQPSRWFLVHLGSGHPFAVIAAPKAEALAIAQQFLALTDWTFDGVDGWRNAEPNLCTMVEALIDSIPNVTCENEQGPNRALAQQIAMARA